MSLAAKLMAFHEGLMERLSPDEAAAVRTAEAALAACGAAARALPVGAPAPDFALADHCGHSVRLADVLRLGPVAVVFFRGSWCPFCSLTLRAYQSVLPAVRAAGASLLAISPQPAAACSAAAECHMLDFPVLSDPGNRVSDAFGVTYEIAPALYPLYRRIGHELPKVNRSGDWRSPLPAAFIIGHDGVIAAAHVETAPYRRLEPAALVAALAAARRRAAL